MCEKVDGYMTVEALIICLIIILIVIKALLTGLTLADHMNVTNYGLIIGMRDMSKAYYYENEKGELDASLKIWDKLDPEYKTTYTGEDKVLEKLLFVLTEKETKVNRKSGRTYVSLVGDEYDNEVYVVDRNASKLMWIIRALVKKGI